MAILKSSLDEPMFSHKQVSVMRVIAHAAQLLEAEMVMQKIKSYDEIKDIVRDSHMNKILAFLKAERKRVLMEIKVPDTLVVDTWHDSSDK